MRLSDPDKIEALRKRLTATAGLLLALKTIALLALSVTSALLLVGFDTLRPDLAKTMHGGLAEQIARGSLGLAAIVFGIALNSSLGGVMFYPFTAKRHGREGRPWEPGRQAFFAIMSISGTALITLWMFLETHGRHIATNLVGVVFVIWIVAVAAISTIIFTRAHKTTRFWPIAKFAFAAIASAAFWAEAVLTMVTVVGNAWDSHHMLLSQYPITPFAVALLCALAITLSSLSLAHRRFSGVALGTVMTLCVMFAADLKDFVALPFIVGR